MYHIIEKLNREDGISVLMVTHDIEAALQYAGSVLHIGAQGQAFYGPAAKYLLWRSADGSSI